MRFRPLTRPLHAPRRARLLAALALMMALATLAMAALGVIGVRGAITALALASLLALLALALAAYSIARIWQETGIGTFDALLASLWSIPVLLAAGLLAYVVTQTPGYRDLSTNVNRPPQFLTLAAAGASSTPLPLDSASPQERIRIALAHPDIMSLFVPRPAWHVAEVMEALARSRDWPMARSQSTDAQTFELEFEVPGPVALIGHDIAVRLVDDGQGTIIDVRSVASMPLHDLGTNSPVLKALMDQILEAIEAMPAPTSDL
jgi:hypothetical protein